MATATDETTMEFETTVEEFAQKAQRYHLKPQTTVRVIVHDKEAPELPGIPFDERIKVLDSMPKIEEDSQEWVDNIRASKQEKNQPQSQTMEALLQYTPSRSTRPAVDVLREIRDQE